MTVKKFFRPWVIYSLSALLLSLVLFLISHFVAGFGEMYSTSVYPFLVNVIAGFNGLFPFAIGEILIYLFVAAALSGIVILVIALIRGKGKRKRILIRALSVFMCAVSSVLLVFMLNCGINYTRDPFSTVCALDTTKEYTQKQLREMIVDAIGKANAIGEYITRDENGKFSFDIEDMRGRAKKAMENIGTKYPCLSGYYPKPKQWLWDDIMSYCFILGVYNPFTIEANYNNNVSRFSVPFTMCHELSHLKGFMQEDEANFIAFLACRESGDADLMYSGYLNLIDYALYDYLGPDYNELVAMLNPEITNQYEEDTEHWEGYDTPIADVSAEINNAYLESNGVEDGTGSYGRFVNLAMYDFMSSVNKK